MSFGAELRRLRLARGEGLRAVAARLGVSTAYLSEVERDLRAPLTGERIAALGLNDADEARLVVLAARRRGDFRLPATGDEATDALAAHLERRWPRIGRAALAALRRDARGR